MRYEDLCGAPSKSDYWAMQVPVGQMLDIILFTGQYNINNL